MSPDDTTLTPALNPGDQLLHFEVQQQIGGGGMGIVWRGYDRLLNRFVAIKQIASPDNLDQIFREKFRDEADLHKRLSQSHPNIVDVIECVDDARGLFIVMEFVDGVSLDRLLAQQPEPMPVLQALRIMRDVTTALTAIHGAGVVHRDLKPGNVLLPADGGPAKVCDFGLAALLAEQDTLNMGTARYMAPELFTGLGADGRVDLYSLGMIVYEMLAGRSQINQTFKAILRDQRNQAMRWMKWHTNQRVTAPPLNTLNEKVPQVLSDLIARMMAKDPGQRIASAPQLLEAIKRHFSKSGLQQQTAEQQVAVAAAATTPATDQADQATAALPKRSRWPIVLAVVFALQGIAVGAYFLNDYLEKQEQAKQLMDDANRAYGRAYQFFKDQQYAQAAQLFQALADQWPGHPRLGTVSRAYVLLSKAQHMMDRAESAMADMNFEQAHEHYAVAEDNMAEADALPLPKEATNLYNRMIRMTKELATRRAFVKEVRTINAAIDQGDFDTARRTFRDLSQLGLGETSVLTPTEQQVLSFLGTRMEDQSTQAEIVMVDQQVAAMIERSALYEARQELEKAQQRFGEHAMLRERMRQVQHRIAYDSALAEARQAEQRDDLAGAVAAYERAQKLNETDATAQTIKRLRSKLAFEEGRRLEAAGQINAAAAKYQQAHSLWDHPQAVARLKELQLADEKASLASAAQSAMSAGDYEQAIDLYDKVLAIGDDAAIRDLRDEATVRMHIERADQLMSQGKLAEAQAALRRALDLAPSDRRAAELLSMIQQHERFGQLVRDADTLRDSGKFGRSQAVYDEAIELADRVGIDAGEIKQRKADTQFDALIAQVRNAINLQVWKHARAMLAVAAKRRPDDPRVRELETELAEHAPPSTQQ